MNSRVDPKKVAVLTSDLGGGTGNHLISMLKYRDKDYWKTTIFTSKQIGAREVSEVPIQYLPPSKYFQFYPFAQIRYLSLIKGKLQDTHPDIVHTYFFWSILYGRLLKHFGKITKLVENREDQGFDWGMHEYKWLRMTRSLPDKIICVSEAVKEVVLEREGVEEKKTVVINNGVDLEYGQSGKQEETRRELGYKEDNLVLGMVANYNRPIKGVTNFLDAIPAIISEVPTARFLFVGGGKEGSALRDKAKALGIEPYIVFTGYKNDIQRYYEIMDISVLTSFSEGLSITLLESMNYGIPVVATHVGGNPEVVVDGKTGYLVPVKDTPILVDRIVKLLKNQNLRRQMGDEGRLRIEDHFQLRKVANKYVEVYKNLLSNT